MSESSTIEAAVRRVRHDFGERAVDILAVEEPLEIRLVYLRGANRVHRSISITMRTPGHDFDLAAGFLYSEGIIGSAREIACVSRAQSKRGGVESDNIVCVELKEGVVVDLKQLERHFYTTSSCGVCGKASLDALRVEVRHAIPPAKPIFRPSVIHQLPEILRREQQVFESTGGLHASALFDPQGKLELLREDIGRHNALDKLIGAKLQENALPLDEFCLLVSGRTSFEIMQKALIAGLPLVAGVGAPSSLAVELANTYHITLLGFVRDGRFNVYSDSQRIEEG